MDNTTSVELQNIKEIKIINEFSSKDAQNEVNKHLKGGWVLLTIEKYISEEGSESIFYHLGLL